MNRKLYNTIVFFFFVASVFAQKADKKYQEKFYTTNNVEVDINASNADIEVQNWNKNEVLVEATIEVEGVDKKEAQKYIEKWQFEALGNKKKVKINANAYKSHSFASDDFVLFNNHHNDNFPTIISGDSIFIQNGKPIHLNGNVMLFNNKLPKLASSVGISKNGELITNLEDLSKGIGTIFLEDLEEFSFPQVQSGVLFSDIDKLEFDFDKYAKEGDVYFFEWKDDAKNIKIESKKEWEKFKKSKEYKRLRRQLKEQKKSLFKTEKELKKIRKQKNALKLFLSGKKKLKKELKEAKGRKKKRIEAQIQLQDVAIGLFSPKSDGKKVKIKKKIIIKAPKKATFSLNTRHCKIKLPNATVSGKASYGTFKADGLIGGNLNIYSSPVDINTLNSCTLLLNNVQDAEINTISNLKLNSNSSTITINNLKDNTDIKDQFGNLEIKNIEANFNRFRLDLNSSAANIKFTNLKKRLNASFYKSGLSFSETRPNMIYKDDGISATGNFKISTNDKTVSINGKYSKINVEN